MPTYDYACDACKHEFELFQSMKEAPKRKCPKCGKNKLRRLIGPGAALVFKGSGFYKTDYRSESYKKVRQPRNPPEPRSPARPRPARTAKNRGKAKKSGPPNICIEN